MNKQKIYIFGNPLLDFDNMPIELKPELEKAFPEVEFIIADPNENLKPENGELVIIDTVVGPKDIIVIDKMEDIEKIESNANYSLHDFDLGFNLKLLKKIGQLKKITIIGIPGGKTKNQIIEKLLLIIKKK